MQLFTCAVLMDYPDDDNETLFSFPRYLSYSSHATKADDACTHEPRAKTTVSVLFVDKPKFTLLAFYRTVMIKCGDIRFFKN